MANLTHSPPIPLPETLAFKHTPFEDCYTILWDQVLGDGATGIVRKCRATDGHEYAVKILQNCEESRMEVACWSTCLPHPNIVPIRDVYDTDIRLPFEHVKRRLILVVMDIMEGGELYYEIQRRKRFEEADAKFITSQIAHAIAHMHSKGICHRDIKMENILLENKNSLKVRIADFGFATGQRAISCKHTPLYAAPEILRSGQFQRLTGRQGLPYSFLCDEWSLGICVYILLCGYAPFRPAANTAAMTSDLHTKIMRGAVEFPEREWALITLEARSFILDLLRVDPTRRMSVQTVLTHGWLTKGLPPAGAHPPASPDEAENLVKFQFDISRSKLLQRRARRLTPPSIPAVPREEGGAPHAKAPANLLFLL
eukprot:m.233073 g.233073  ORF g.233073 m.233073 type:complete len:370 (+) comp12455_c0_seq1:87-1196(+)